MSVCPKPEDYSVYVDGELSENLEKDLTKHLANCEECRKMLEGYLSVKAVLNLDDAPEIDLDESFDSLVQKRREYETRISYIILALLRKNIRLASVFFGTFALFLASYFSVSYLYEAKQNSTKFVPILPMSRSTSSKVRLNDMNVREINIFANISKKNNVNRYSNFTKTFNNFSQLYSQLDDEPYGETKMVEFNGSNFYQYASSKPIYKNLGENEK